MMLTMAATSHNAATLLLLLTPCTYAARDWRLLDQFPGQYVARKLGDGESIQIDGTLDDKAWDLAEWTEAMVDITHHTNQLFNPVPADVNARVKVRWDDDYFYVGAELNEPFVTGDLYGHNGQTPPYLNDDFEVFIDVSGTTQYYIEYEMSVLNATYDIKWGRPDISPCFKNNCCDNTGDSWPVLPTCVNTSFPGYNGNWTMATRYHPGNTTAVPPALIHGSAVPGSRGTTASTHTEDDTGLLAATSWDPDAWEKYTFPNSMWSLEIRFPIRQTPNYWTKAGGPATHGGLTDSDPMRQEEWNQYDPSLGDAGPGRPRYWWVNFAKAEHPRQYTLPDGSKYVCPKNCTQKLEFNVNSTPIDGDFIKDSWPTYLGGYWEWVWGPVGTANPGVGYMHRPSSFKMIQFAPSTGAALCRNIEFPGRHVAKSIYLAQIAYSTVHNNSFSKDLKALLDPKYCNLDLGTSDTCDFYSFQYAMEHPDVYGLKMTVVENVEKLTRSCPSRPCFIADVTVMVPESKDVPKDPRGGYQYTVSINTGRDTTVKHADPMRTAPCL